MKDAKGHGSNPGNTTAAAWRAAHPAHQTGIMQKIPGLVQAFAKNESGLGHPIQEEREVEMAVRKYDPEKLGRFLGEAGHTIASGEHQGLMEGGKMLLHLAHYLALIGGIAVIDLLAHGIALVSGWHLS